MFCDLINRSLYTGCFRAYGSAADVQMKRSQPHSIEGVFLNLIMMTLRRFDLQGKSRRDRAHAASA
jgi:hypothetical protein